MSTKKSPRASSSPKHKKETERDLTHIPGGGSRASKVDIRENFGPRVSAFNHKSFLNGQPHQVLAAAPPAPTRAVIALYGAIVFSILMEPVMMNEAALHGPIRALFAALSLFGALKSAETTKERTEEVAEDDKDIAEIEEGFDDSDEGFDDGQLAALREFLQSRVATEKHSELKGAIKFLTTKSEFIFSARFRGRFFSRVLLELKVTDRLKGPDSVRQTALECIAVLVDMLTEINSIPSEEERRRLCEVLNCVCGALTDVNTWMFIILKAPKKAIEACIRGDFDADTMIQLTMEELDFEFVKPLKVFSSVECAADFRVHPTEFKILVSYLAKILFIDWGKANASAAVEKFSEAIFNLYPLKARDFSPSEREQYANLMMSLFPEPHPGQVKEAVSWTQITDLIQKNTARQESVFSETQREHLMDLASARSQLRAELDPTDPTTESWLVKEVKQSHAKIDELESALAQLNQQAIARAALQTKIETLEAVRTAEEAFYRAEIERLEAEVRRLEASHRDEVRRLEDQVKDLTVLLAEMKWLDDEKLLRMAKLEDELKDRHAPIEVQIAARKAELKKLREEANAIDDAMKYNKVRDVTLVEALRKLILQEETRVQDLLHPTNDVTPPKRARETTTTDQ